MKIRTIQKGFEAFEWKFKPFEGIQNIRMKIRTIRKGLEALERDSKYSNENSNHSKGIGSIRMEIRTIYHYSTEVRFKALTWFIY